MRFKINSPTIIAITTMLTAILFSTIAWGQTSILNAVAEPSVSSMSSQEINWQRYSDSLFSQAKVEGRLIFIYAKSSWCEWCKKFDEETLKDPALVAIINKKFDSVILDIDVDRDAVVNYAITSLPTILIIDSEKKIIKSSSGYKSASEMMKFLDDVIKDNPIKSESLKKEEIQNNAGTNAVSILSDSTRRLLMEKQWLFYSKDEPEDDGQSYANESEMRYVSRFATQFAIGLVQGGNQVAKKWLNTTLDNGLLLIDPIWGGMYSGSSNGDWVHPNYEKKLSIQAINVPLYLDAYALTKNRQYYNAAESMINYMLNFLVTPDGTFYLKQNAKMKDGKQNADYYTLNDSLRRMEGIPDVDKKIVTADNALAVSALNAMYMETGNKIYLDAALKAMSWMINHLGTPDGGFRHSPNNNESIYLDDNTQMAKALIKLYASTTELQWLLRAQRALDYIEKHFRNPSGEPGYVSVVPLNASSETKYETSPIYNTSLGRTSALIYAYTRDKKYLAMAQESLKYLVSPDVITNANPVLVLIANAAVTTPPLNITVIGAKDDPATIELYFAALKFPSFYITYHLYSSTAEAEKVTGMAFPSLNKPSAFFCSGQRCSLPIFTAEEFQLISNKLTQQQNAAPPVNLISNVSTLFPKYSSMRIQAEFSNILISHDWKSIVFIFWVIGLLLAFTPCVFPLLLVLSTMLMSASGAISQKRMFFLTMTYILSLSITYALVGYAAGMMGIYLQFYLQQPILLLVMSVMLAILAFSLLGGYKIKLPQRIQHSLIRLNSFHASNTFIGAALMGMVLTLIASPCAAAPLIGVLSIITQIGDPILGMIALFVMGLGVGTPLLVAWFARETVLPRVQAWQYELEIAFGLLMLGVSIWMASRVIDFTIYLVLLSGLVIVTAIFMGVLEETRAGSFGKFWKAASIMMLVYGVALLAGVLLGNENQYTPLAFNQNVLQPYHQANLGVFHTVDSEAELIRSLEQAKVQKRPVILDFYASWCVACVDIERDVFTLPDVSHAMLDFTLLRVDLSTRDSGSLAIANKFGVIAPPTMIFFDSRGYELENRLYGDVQPEVLVRVLTDVSSKQ